MIAKYSFQVRWGDTDAAGIVFYPNYYKWMDEATHEYLSALGYPSSKLYAEKQIGVPLLEANCIFKGPLFFEDNVIVQSAVEELQNKVFKLRHAFIRGEQIVAEGYELRAWTSFEGKPKALPIPDDIRKKMMPKTHQSMMR
ncbi:4-hydroxybenzoyl-CoA thioesterase [Peribacillus simplex]|jgi:acyl-CoA thioester hydrolase|nr:4-hydroxybenzoyl-CoA thioesterase [Peribacillus simplex]